MSRADAGDRGALELSLGPIAAVAAARWGLTLDPGRFADYVAERLPAAPPPGDPLSGLQLEDLYLCCGCVDGEPVALAHFERELLAPLALALARLDSSGDLATEVTQLVRCKLLVPDADGPPRLAEYQGRGRLLSWLRVIATREALMIRRRSRRDAPVTAVAEAVTGDLDLALLARGAREAFGAAVATALGELTGRERNLLHYHFVGRLTIDQIGAIYRVHRVTAFRWLSAARGALVAGARRHLAGHLGVASHELDSLIRPVRSQLDVTLERVLAAGAPARSRGRSRR